MVSAGTESGRSQEPSHLAWHRTPICMNSCASLAEGWGTCSLLSSNPDRARMHQRNLQVWNEAWKCLGHTQHMHCLQLLPGMQALPLPKTWLSLQKINCSLSKSVGFLYNRKQSFGPPRNQENQVIQQAKYGSGKHKFFSYIFCLLKSFWEQGWK